MIGRDEDVGGVGAGQLFHQVHEVAKRVVHRLEHLTLGAGFIPRGVDPVVVDVQNPVGLVQFAPLIGVEGLEVLGLDRGASDCLQNLAPEAGVVGRLVIREHRLGVRRVLERRVRQQRRHTELGVARQHPEHGLQVGVEAVFLPNERAELVGHLVAHGVRDDHDGLLVAVAY
ncbi:hypothetical protein SDC9_100728 [bioreactor metagenome]|uniref:Uncharacterized protein n=1 Tax=bioreactor metagenome TaxID=1076179 RepID=A0A645AM03_9ZZZZ